nr:uncharacterized protein LOC127346009 [Lolium perenne]
MSRSHPFHRSRRPLPPSRGSRGESRPRPLCRSPLPSVTGIAGRVTDPFPPSLGSSGASSSYPIPPADERRPRSRHHGGRVSSSSSTSPPSIASVVVGKLRVGSSSARSQSDFFSSMAQSGVTPPLSSTAGSDLQALQWHRSGRPSHPCLWDWTPSPQYCRPAMDGPRDSFSRFQQQPAVVTAGARMLQPVCC